MQYIYHKDAPNDIISIDAQLHKYLFKVRRHNIENNISFRNLNDNNIYNYKVENISRRETTLKLIDFKTLIIEPSKQLHIGWCKIDFKSISSQITHSYRKIMAYCF